MKKLHFLLLCLLSMHRADYANPALFLGVGSTLGKALLYTAIAGGAGYYGIPYAAEKVFDEWDKRNEIPDYKVYEPGEINASFSSVVGFSHEKERFADILRYLKDPSLYDSMGIRPSKGILLSGAPGTGKTTFVRALAGEANCPFIYVDGSSVDISKLFSQAKQLNSPSIIFVDEFEGLGSGKNGSIIRLLTELDGFIKDKTNHPIIFIAATNHPDKIDEALKRPGRLEQHIEMEVPHIEDRKSILAYYLKKVASENNIDLSFVAKQSIGFTPAMLESAVQEAGRMAIARQKSCITIDELEDAIDIKQVGYTQKKNFSAEHKKIISYHEAGHALTSMLLRKDRWRVHKMTSTPRGEGAGITFFENLQEKSISLDFKENQLNDIAVMLGGRAAEEIGCNIISSSPRGDLEEATKLVKYMVYGCGMGKSLSVIHTESREDEVEEILKNEYQRALNLLKNNRKKLDALANALFEKSVLRSDEIYKLVDL